MTDIFIIRDPPDPAKSFGVLSGIDSILQTIELPWIPDPGGAPCGHPDQSCVPCGVYKLVKHSSEKHPQTFALVNEDLRIFHLPGDCEDGGTFRWGCLIHPDNVTATLLGCIGPGLERGTLNGAAAVLESVTAFGRLMAALPWEDGHTLTITQEGT